MASIPVHRREDGQWQDTYDTMSEGIFIVGEDHLIIRDITEPRAASARIS